MILYIANRNMSVLKCYTSDDQSSGVTIEKDEEVDSIENGVRTFSFDLLVLPEKKEEIFKTVQSGYYVLRQRKRDNLYEYFTIITVEFDGDSTFSVYAEDEGMDLLNEILPAINQDPNNIIAYNLDKYINDCVYDTGFSVRYDDSNEVKDARNSKIALSGSEETALKRLQEVASAFGVEFSFGFDISRLTITAKYLYISGKRGKDNGKQYRVGKELTGIGVKSSVEQLYTAVVATGATVTNSDNSTTQITLAGYSYDDGDFCVSGNALLSRKSLEKWSRYLSETGKYDVGHIVAYKSFNDATTQEELCKEALQYLKKYCNPIVNYSAKFLYPPDDLAIGDYAYLIDDEAGIYLKARVLELTVSELDETFEATFGDFLLQSSGIISSVQEIADKVASVQQLYTWIVYADDLDGNGISKDSAGKQFIGMATNKSIANPDLTDASLYTWTKIKGEDAVTITIESSNGTTFKNSKIATTLTVDVIVGDEVITDSTALVTKFGNTATLKWKQKKEGTQDWVDIDPSDSRFGDNGFMFTIRPDDINERTVFSCELNVKEEG